VLGSPVVVSLIVIVALVAGTYLLLGVLAKRTDGRHRSRATAGNTWARRLPAVLLVGAVACLIAALAQFRFNSEVDEAAVMLAMDTSESMNQTDVRPTRIDAAVSAARSFLDEVPPGFRIGLVTFAGSADLAVGPTADRAVVSEALSDLRRVQGTVIGDGMDVALDAIEADRTQIANEPAAIVLLSDGRDTGSVSTPTAVADRANDLDVRIFTVVLGSTDAEAGANASLLQSVADRTGGQAFSAQDAGELTSVYDALGSRLSSELAISNSAALFVVIAVVLALAAGVAVLVTSRSQF